MIEPLISPVAPRVYSPVSGSVLQLVDEIELLISRGEPVTVRLEGEGNVSALSHVSAHLGEQVASGCLRLESKTLLSLDSVSAIVTVCADPSNAFLTPEQRSDGHYDFVLRLTPWGRDDFIEYLLAAHPQQCASVMSRLEHAEISFVDGSPVLWKMILDRMAASEARTNIESIILEEVDLRINDPELGIQVADQLIFPLSPDQVGVLGHGAKGNTAAENVLVATRNSPAAELLSHERVKHAFAIRRVVQRLRTGGVAQAAMLFQFPVRIHSLMHIATKIAGDEESQQKLNTVFHLNRRWSTSNSATVLAQSDPSWRPRGENAKLYRGFFNDVVWPDVNLEKADLRRASLANADLSGANFCEASLSMCNFAGAKLHAADFHNSRRMPRAAGEQCLIASVDEQPEPTDAPQASVDDEPKKKPKIWQKLLRKESELKRSQQQELEKTSQTKRAITRNQASERAQRDQDLQFLRVDFTGCDLTSANLSNCCFKETNFTSAALTDVVARGCAFTMAILDDVELCGADLSWSSFQGSDLRNATIDRCRFVGSRFLESSFEDVRADVLVFDKAHLRNSTWTDSKLTDCSFQSANLQGARLADIDWENCDLRKADLRGCTFHMGSSRSGTVGSPYPSHGTRTGYYTDDYNDQHFKSPESIRKASLLACDLRGANIAGVDFYLVDLRAAKFDAAQRQQLISTGAILDDDAF